MVTQKHRAVCSPFGGIPRNWKLCSTLGYCLTVGRSPFGGIPRNWKPDGLHLCLPRQKLVPPSGGSLEIGNLNRTVNVHAHSNRSPFGGIPRNWKRYALKATRIPAIAGSPFGGIPRNWKHPGMRSRTIRSVSCSPFGGIPRNWKRDSPVMLQRGFYFVPPSGGSLEIGNIGVSLM